MLRILFSFIIVITLLSPVSAQQLAEPLVFYPDAVAVQTLAGIRQSDPSCVIGNGGSFAAPAASLPFSLDTPIVFAESELPLLTLPDAGVSSYHIPRSLTWLPDSQPLFAIPAFAGEIVFDVPLLFPGLGRRSDFFGATAGHGDFRPQAALHDSRQENVIYAAARPDRAVVSSLPSSVLPASMHNALDGLHKLWACVGTDPTQLAFAAAGAGAPAASAALPAAPSWEVNELANNLGGLGRIYRATYGGQPALVVNRLASANHEELAFRVSQAEFNGAGVGCFKASPDNRIAATKQDNGNAVIAMGPDFENKTFHVIFNGGLSGQVGGTVTSYDGPPGANCS